MYIFHSKLLFICDFSIHPYIHICMHAHMHIYWWFDFFQRYVKIQKNIHTCIHTCVCRVFFWCFLEFIFKKAEVLSVRFPKEYDHKNLAAKHPKLCTYVILNSVYLWFPSIHPYIHICMHTHMHIYWWFEFFPKICINTKHIYIHTCVRVCVCRVFFWCFLEFIFKKQRF